MWLKRKVFQFLFAILNNFYFIFPFTKKIYQGNLKYLCSPGLNCYSCPASLFACPIGAFQNFMINLRVGISFGKYYLGLFIIGFLGTIGMLFGRIVCGWVCPFGLFQEILYKIPTKKFKFHIPYFYYLKYIVLILLVIICPLFFTDQFGYGTTTFCKYFCPTGTLEAGLTLPFLMPSLKKMIGMLYYWKLFILVIFIILFVLTKRPFCRYFCPLGAFYSIFNKFSFFKLNKNHSKCTNCLMCESVCSMQLKLEEIPDSGNCIRCFNCVKICPEHAIEIKCDKILFMK